MEDLKAQLARVWRLPRVPGAWNRAEFESFEPRHIDSVCRSLSDAEYRSHGWTSQTCGANQKRRKRLDSSCVEGREEVRVDMLTERRVDDVTTLHLSAFERVELPVELLI